MLYFQLSITKCSLEIRVRINNTVCIRYTEPLKVAFLAGRFKQII